MDLNLLAIPGVGLVRAILGWAENSLPDGVTLLEWRKLGETVIRMGTPMVALVFGLKMDPILAAGLVTIFDIVLTKGYSALKSRKK